MDGWMRFFPSSLRALPSLTQFSDAIMDARLRKSLANVRARHRAHANWGVLFKLRQAVFAFQSFFFFDDSKAAYASLCGVYRIYADDMQCDQIIPLFPFPVFCSEGISLRRVPQMSWLPFPLEDRSICCAKKNKNPVDLKELGSGICSSPVQASREAKILTVAWKH